MNNIKLEQEAKRTEKKMEIKIKEASDLVAGAYKKLKEIESTMRDLESKRQKL